MTTLIFKTKKDLKSRFASRIITEFVKESDFVTAMNYFDDSDPTFYQTKESDNFNSEIDPNGYYINGNGSVIVTDSQLEKSTEHRNMDNSEGYYTKNSNNLNREELIAISKENIGEDVFLENGFTSKEFNTALDNNKIDFLIDLGTGCYL